MADQQDFEIKIRVNADVSQVETVKRSFEQLGAQVQVTNLNAAKAAAASAGAGLGNISELGRLVGQFAGVGIAGTIYQFVNGLREASSEIAKVAEGLDKQGAQLVENAQKLGDQARLAKDEGDVLKISDATLKEIASTQKTFNDLSQKELSTSEKISDYLQVQLLARQKIAGVGDYEAAQQQNLKTALDQLQAARQKGMEEVLAAEAAENQTYEEKRSSLDQLIAKEEERKQKAASDQDPGGYVKAANNLSKLRIALDDVIRLEAQRRSQQAREDEATAAEHEKDVDFVQEQVKRASPTARSILRNEQAAQIARDQGRDRDAELFQRAADQFKQSATPQQQQEVGVLEKLIEQNGLLREIRDTWK